MKNRRYHSDLKDQKDAATYLENLLLDLLTFVIEEQKQKNKFKKLAKVFLVRSLSLVKAVEKSK